MEFGTQSSLETGIHFWIDLKNVFQKNKLINKKTKIDNKRIEWSGKTINAISRAFEKWDAFILI